MPKIGMIFHPTNNYATYDAIASLYPWFRRIFNRESLLTSKSFLKNAPSFKYLSIDFIVNNTLARVNVNFYFLPLIPEHFLSLPKDYINRRIIRIIKRAEKEDIALVTLGAFTSISTGQGKDLEGKISVPITTGNTYTSAVCIHSILKLVDKLGLDISKLSLGIIGATGDIGSACAKYFIKHVGRLILCSRSAASLIDNNPDFKKYMNKISIERDPSKAVAKANVIICATSSIYPILKQEDIRPGSIICDISVPSSISSEILKHRNDVIVYEGGNASHSFLADVNNRKWAVLFPNKYIYGCLAESIILGAEKRFENYSSGRGLITTNKIDEIYSLGLKYGFDFSAYMCSGYIYNENDFERIKGIIKRKIL